MLQTLSKYYIFGLIKPCIDAKVVEGV